MGVGEGEVAPGLVGDTAVETVDLVGTAVKAVAAVGTAGARQSRISHGCVRCSVVQ